MNRKPLEGTKQGDWLILSYIKNDGKKSWYNCRCLCCGKEKPVRADKMTSGRSKRCIDCSLFFSH